MSFLDLCPFVSKIRLAFELDMSSQQTPPFGKGSSSLLQKNKQEDQVATAITVLFHIYTHRL